MKHKLVAFEETVWKTCIGSDNHIFELFNGRGSSGHTAAMSAREARSYRKSLIELGIKHRGTHYKRSQA